MVESKMLSIIALSTYEISLLIESVDVYKCDSFKLRLMKKQGWNTMLLTKLVTITKKKCLLYKIMS